MASTGEDGIEIASSDWELHGYKPLRQTKKETKEQPKGPKSVKLVFLANIISWRKQLSYLDELFKMLYDVLALKHKYKSPPGM